MILTFFYFKYTIPVASFSSCVHDANGATVHEPSLYLPPPNWSGCRVEHYVFMILVVQLCRSPGFTCLLPVVLAAVWNTTCSPLTSFFNYTCIFGYTKL